MDEPTLGEIGRRLTDLTAEVRALRTELVRGDVYIAHRAADELRIKALEGDLEQIREARKADAEDRTAVRRLVYAALLSTAGSIVASIVLAVITLAIGRR